MSKPLGLRIQEAVMNSDLPADLRHLVHVMAVSGNGETCVGWLSQASLARLMGCSERHVRALLSKLEAADSHPVRLVRHARFRADGRGRTSDEWQLVLVDPTNRHSVPPEQPSAGTARTTNRHATTDQPAQHAGDPRRDPRGDPRSSFPEPPQGVAKAPKPRRPAQRSLGLDDPAESADHKRVVEAYFKAFEAARGRKPTFGSREGKAAKGLRERLGADGAVALIGRVYARGSWWSDKATLVDLAQNPDKYDQSARAPQPRFARPVQQGSVVDDAAARASAEALFGK